VSATKGGHPFHMFILQEVCTVTEQLAESCSVPDISIDFEGGEILSTSRISGQVKIALLK
jgi:hypothetical protein